MLDLNAQAAHHLIVDLAEGGKRMVALGTDGFLNRQFRMFRWKIRNHLLAVIRRIFHLKFKVNAFIAPIHSHGRAVGQLLQHAAGS